jgi:hypothetical protein
MPSIN